jgi:hypothetical protein
MEEFNAFLLSNAEFVASLAKVSRPKQSYKCLCEVRLPYTRISAFRLSDSECDYSGMQEDLKMFGNQYTYAVSAATVDIILLLMALLGHCLHLRICHHANSVNAYYSESATKLLARSHGNRMGNFYFCPSRNA